MEKAVFKSVISDSRTNASKRLPQTALVVSDQRTVLVAHWKLPGQCITLCHMVQPIQWTGILRGKIERSAVMNTFLVITSAYLFHLICCRSFNLTLISKRKERNKKKPNLSY